MSKSKTSENKFFPYFLFEIALTALFTFEAVLILAVLFPSSPGREIDFTAQYQPRPEWYFLFLYQLTKYFPGAWTFVGAVLLPGLAFSILLLAPVFDNRPETSLSQRKGAMLTGSALLLIVIILTLLSLV